jgi:fatty-acyl-CoA synthase
LVSRTEDTVADEHGYQYPLLIKRLLMTPLVNAPEQEIVYRGLKRYNYRALGERIGQLASALADLGVEFGDTVAMMDWDSHRYLECFFAVPMMGAVLQTVNVRLSSEQVLYTLNHAGPKVVLVNRDFLPLLEEIKDQLETVEKFVLVTDTGDCDLGAIPVAAEYEQMVEGSSSAFEFPDLDENTRATIFYTTGTTGLPKGVYFTHRQLVLHTLVDLAAFGTSAVQGRFHQGDVYMPITPMFHVHAWGLPYTATVLGVKQVYPGRYTPETLLELKEREGATFSHCVPTILHMMLTHPASKNVDMRGWKIVIGGSALPKALAKAAMERGIDIFCGYGMSETCPLLTTSHLSPALLSDNMDYEIEMRVTAGRAVPLVELRVVDPDMNDVPRDGKTSGEIVVRTPWLTQGYFNNPEASKALWAGGYLHTNDIGVLGTDGYLRITDRLKDVIKTGGEWISSLEVEDVITQHPAVSDVCVIGVSDAKWGERPMAIVVLKDEFIGKVDAEGLKDHMKAFVEKGIISKFGIPDRIIFVDTLLKTSVGKLDKKTMRIKYGS